MAVRDYGLLTSFVFAYTVSPHPTIGFFPSSINFYSMIKVGLECHHVPTTLLLLPRSYKVLCNLNTALTLSYIIPVLVVWDSSSGLLVPECMNCLKLNKLKSFIPSGTLQSREIKNICCPAWDGPHELLCLPLQCSLTLNAPHADRFPSPGFALPFCQHAQGPCFLIQPARPLLLLCSLHLPECQILSVKSNLLNFWIFKLCIDI